MAMTCFLNCLCFKRRKKTPPQRSPPQRPRSVSIDTVMTTAEAGRPDSPRPPPPPGRILIDWDVETVTTVRRPENRGTPVGMSLYHPKSAPELTNRTNFKEKIISADERCARSHGGALSTVNAEETKDPSSQPKDVAAQATLELSGNTLAEPSANFGEVQTHISDSRRPPPFQDVQNNKQNNKQHESHICGNNGYPHTIDKFEAAMNSNRPSLAVRQVDNLDEEILNLADTSAENPGAGKRPERIANPKQGSKRQLRHQHRRIEEYLARYRAEMAGLKRLENKRAATEPPRATTEGANHAFYVPSPGEVDERRRQNGLPVAEPPVATVEVGEEETLESIINDQIRRDEREKKRKERQKKDRELAAEIAKFT